MKSKIFFTLCFGFLLGCSKSEPAAVKEAAQQGQTPIAQPVAKVETSGAPKIEIPTASYDFGEVWEGTKVEHTFVVNNTGEQLLTISKVKPSCGCTVTDDYTREIPAGGNGTIKVGLNTTRLGAKVNKSITVSSNDPAQPNMQLLLTGQVKSRIVMEPAEGANLGRVAQGTTIEKIIRLKNNTQQPMNLSASENLESGPFRAQLSTLQPGQEYQLTIRNKEPLPEKFHRGNFILLTDLPELPQFDIPVSVFVIPSVEVKPSVLVIPQAEAKESTRTVEVNFQGDKEQQVVGAEVAANPEIVVTWEKNPKNDKSYIVSLILPANYLPPDNNHLLKIYTDDSAHAEVIVPLVKRPTSQAAAKPADKLLGQMIPEAKFTLMDGQAFPSKDAKTSLFMFYASWCGYCKKALPQLDELAKEYKDKELRLVAVSQDSMVEDGASGPRARTKEQLVEQWKELGVSLPQAMDTEHVGRAKFFVQSFPMIFLVNKDGKIEKIYYGAGDALNGNIKKDVDVLLSGKSLLD